MKFDNRIENFVIMPRQIIKDLHNGDITVTGFSVLCYIRLSGDPYGVATISLENIRNDVLKGASVNYCNKILLGLKSKRYIYYEQRSGRRGSFHVELGDWILPNKKLKTLDTFFNGDSVRGPTSVHDEPPSEDGQSLPSLSQSFGDQKDSLLAQFSFENIGSLVRGTNNDTYKDKETDNYRCNKKLIALRDFTPISYEEEQCLAIAVYFGEKTINPILALLKQYGLDVIKKAYEVTKKDTQKKSINNERAYFQSVAETIGKTGQ